MSLRQLGAVSVELLEPAAVVPVEVVFGSVELAVDVVTSPVDPVGDAVEVEVSPVEVVVAACEHALSCCIDRSPSSTHGT
jgi:hypothetical protein